MESGIIDRTVFFPIKRVTEKEAGGVGRRREAELDLPRTARGSPGPGRARGQRVREPPLVEPQETRLGGRAAESVTLVSAVRGGSPTARMPRAPGVSISVLITIRNTQFPVSVVF